MLGDGASAQFLELGKDEPHPVRRLMAGTQLIQYVSVDSCLGIDEALKVEGIGHGWISLPEFWCLIFWLCEAVDSENWEIELIA